ncbi:MAG: hypothetical protein WCE70_05420 [Rhodanobacteraceae bacterium]
MPETTYRKRLQCTDGWLSLPPAAVESTGPPTISVHFPPLAMLSLPDHPRLDKAALIGGCAKLDLDSDAARLQAEIAALPQELWGRRGGRVGVHNPADERGGILRKRCTSEGEE